MIDIIKASAGSGKTYTLANTYIDMLLNAKDEFAYRHILAVTFTNKATAEMKSRILKELHVRSKTDPRAREILINILHDYTAFSISTIDKFFQQTLKAFSREIGQFAAYQIELDRDSLIGEAMDRILDNLTEDDRDLIEWLRSNVLDQLETAGKFSLDNALHDMGKKLKSEEHRELTERYGLKDHGSISKKRLELIRKECRTIITGFEKDSKAAAEDAKDKIGNKTALKGLSKYLNPTRGMFLPMPSSTLLKCSDGTDFHKLYTSDRYKDYGTARVLNDLLFSMGLAREFYSEFDALLKEKNVMCLDESNTILRDIIDGSDAPFVYEKLGVRYENFLLDEFQDTSSIQWENFLPLIRESESKGRRSLVVGDVKQSIYRWRGSDWNLLNTKITEQFPKNRTTVLDGNWRSAETVVEFNNRFFEFSAKVLGEEKIYADVRQKVNTKELQTGSVRVSFCDKDEKMGLILESIQEALSRGARYEDVAILIRSKKTGTAIASYLIDAGIPVISDDSLSLKSSSVVRRIVSLLSCINNPEDSVNSFLAKDLGVDIPDTYHSLTDLAEHLLRELKSKDENIFDGEAIFIQAFMDDLQNWVEINGNDLSYYLKHWSESELFIGLPENTGSVRILTVHKSKGLEFPYVIFPFAEEVSLYKSDDHWEYLNPEGTAFSAAAEGIYPVKLTNESANTHFCEGYDKEKRYQSVDNINLFYVAMTRAVDCLHVIAEKPSKKFIEALDKDRQEYSRMSEILYKFCGKSEDYRLGQEYDFRMMERKMTDPASSFPARFTSFPLDGRLTPSQDASDFFGEDGVVGTLASSRLNGVALHDILSKIQTISDLDPAMKQAVRDGILTEEEAVRHAEMLKDRIESHPEWFSGNGRNEVTLIDAFGKELRPDRVVLSTDNTVVIDYKFGKENEKKYRNQVRSYMKLYKALGYPGVKGYIWYIPDDSITEVKL